MRFSVIFVALLVASCMSMSSTSEPVPATLPDQLGSGLELTNFDKTIRPQDDLYRFVNGKWLDTFEIPEDKSNYGHFTKLYDEAQQNLKAIILDSAATADKRSLESAQIGDAYQAFMNTDTIESLSLSPLNEELKRISQLATHEDVVRQMGRLMRLRVSGPAYLWISPDAKKTTEYIVHLTQSGLGLPDRDYYLKQEEKFRGIRTKYLTYLQTILQLAAHRAALPAAEPNALRHGGSQLLPKGHRWRLFE